MDSTNDNSPDKEKLIFSHWYRVILIHICHTFDEADPNIKLYPNQSALVIYNLGNERMGFPNTAFIKGPLRKDFPFQETLIH